MHQSKYIYLSKLATWWKTVFTYTVFITENHLIFSLSYDSNHFLSINYVICLGKIYLYTQIMSEKGIYFIYFLIKPKFKLDIEKIICE